MAHHLIFNLRSEIIWIGRAGQFAWPERSPDLTPLDYYMWGPHEILDLRDPYGIQGGLLPRIMAAANVRGPSIGNRVYQDMDGGIVSVFTSWSSHRTLLVSGPRRQAAGVSESNVCCGILRVAGKRHVSGHEFLC